MAGKRRDNPIPVEHRLAVNYLGLDYTEIVSLKVVSDLPMVLEPALAQGRAGVEGPYPRPRVVDAPGVPHLAHLLNSTRDCPTCEGTGKVPQDARGVGQPLLGRLRGARSGGQ